MCFPLLVVSSQLLIKAIAPKLTSLISLPSANRLPVAACNTSKFKSRQLLNKETTETSLGILIYELEN